jgi:hypothetical protein
MFDIYHSYAEQAVSMFDVAKMAPFKPFVAIYDLSESPEMLEKHPYGVLPPEEELRNSYLKKYVANEIYFGEGLEALTDHFIERWLD